MLGLCISPLCSHNYKGGALITSTLQAQLREEKSLTQGHPARMRLSSDSSLGCLAPSVMKIGGVCCPLACLHPSLQLFYLPWLRVTSHHMSACSRQMAD